MMRLMPLNHDFALLIEIDRAAAHAQMMDRLHRAVLIMACQRGDGPRLSDTYWPERIPEHMDYDNVRAATGRDYVRILEKWAQEINYAASEIDEADTHLSLMQGLPTRKQRTVSIRAWQEHRERTSWANIGIAVGCSENTAKAWHHGCIEHALNMVHWRLKKGLAEIAEFAA